MTIRYHLIYFFIFIISCVNNSERESINPSKNIYGNWRSHEDVSWEFCNSKMFFHLDGTFECKTYPKSTDIPVESCTVRWTKGSFNVQHSFLELKYISEKRETGWLTYSSDFPPITSKITMPSVNELISDGNFYQTSICLRRMIRSQ